LAFGKQLAKLVGIDRFEQVPVKPGCLSFRPILIAAESGYGNQVGPLKPWHGPNALGDLQPRHVRHGKVAQNDVG
jgi:hypothetical protein